MRAYSVFVRRAKLDSYRFRLFELRDDLAFGAMKGEINPDSEEYNTMISLINSTIKRAAVWDPFALATFFMNVSSQEKLIKTQERIKRLDDKCKELTFLREINKRFFEISMEIFHYNIRPKLIIKLVYLARNISKRTRKWFYIFNGAEQFLANNLQHAPQYK